MLARESLAVYAMHLQLQLTVSPRATPCVFVGYPPNYKGYKLWSLTDHKFLISQDVIFHETIFPFHTSDPQYIPGSSHQTVIPTQIPDTTPFDPHNPPNPPDPPNLDQTDHVQNPLNLPQPEPNIPVPDHNDLVQHPPNPPQPEPNINPLLRRSTRLHNPPNYLQDYLCNVTYPIQKHLTYDRLSPSYRQYVMQV